MTWPDVDAAVRAAVREHTGMRAVDPERLASYVTTEREGTRTPTVRATGHEGARQRHDPLEAVARGRVLALLRDLGEVQAKAVVVVAVHGSLRQFARDRGVHHSTAQVWAALGRAKLDASLRRAGLLDDDARQTHEVAPGTTNDPPPESDTGS